MKKKHLKILYFLLLFLSVLLIFQKTLFRHQMSSRYFELAPFWKFWGSLRNKKKINSDVVKNVFLFAPFGFSLYLINRNKLRVLVIGFITSLSIELTQLIFKLGWFETEDILNNVIGTALGLFVSWCLTALIRKIWKSKDVQQSNKENI